MILILRDGGQCCHEVLETTGKKRKKKQQYGPLTRHPEQSVKSLIDAAPVKSFKTCEVMSVTAFFLYISLNPLQYKEKYFLNKVVYEGLLTGDDSSPVASSINCRVK